MIDLLVPIAHGLVGRADLPIPQWLFGWAAAVVLVVSFVALAVLWPKPRLEEPAGRKLARIPAWIEPLCGVIGLAVFGLVVYSGLAGSQTATENILPTFVYVLFWVGVPVLCLLFGDVFRPFNPWLAIARFVSWAAGRVRRADAPEAIPYPQWLGRWPAAAGILIFAWVELAYTNTDDPSTLAILALAYAAFQLVGMSVFGIETWSRRADAFGVYFGLFGLLSPLHRVGSELRARRPLSGVTSVDPAPGTVALLAVMIGSTAFDGASEGPLWNDVGPDLASGFADLGFGASRALELSFTVGLIAGCLIIAGIYRLGVLGMRTVGSGHDARELSRRFVHTLIPIALAYVVAHYFSLLAYQGQATAYLISDPLGEGSDIFGTATAAIDYGVVTATGIWYVQVGALVIGHVAALVLAHDRALVVWGTAREATRSQYWMLAVMVGFTSLGLYLLSSSNT